MPKLHRINHLSHNIARGRVWWPLWHKKLLLSFWSSPFCWLFLFTAKVGNRNKQFVWFQEPLIKKNWNPSGIQLEAWVNIFTGKQFFIWNVVLSIDWLIWAFYFCGELSLELFLLQLQEFSIILFHKLHTTDIHSDNKTNDYGDWLLM